MKSKGGKGSRVGKGEQRNFRVEQHLMGEFRGDAAEETRPDTGQSSHGRFGRGDAKTARN